MAPILSEYIEQVRHILAHKHGMTLDASDLVYVAGCEDAEVPAYLVADAIALRARVLAMPNTPQICGRR